MNTREDLRDVEIRIVHFIRKDGKTALLHRFNACIRVLDGYSHEHNFRELHNAIKHLIDLDYQMVINI